MKILQRFKLFTSLLLLAGFLMVPIQSEAVSLAKRLIKIDTVCLVVVDGISELVLMRAEKGIQN